MPNLDTDTLPMTRNRARSKVYTFHLLTRQHNALKDFSEQVDVPIAEIIRRSIDHYIKLEAPMTWRRHAQKRAR